MNTGSGESLTGMTRTLQRVGVAADHGGFELKGRQLEEEGVDKFNKPFDKLPETLKQRSARHLTGES